MKKHEITIHHQGQTKSYQLREGLGLMALEAQGAPLEFDCRQADCGICIFKVKAGSEGLSPPTPREQDFLRAMHAKPEERLACQCRVFAAITLELENYDP